MHTRYALKYPTLIQILFTHCIHLSKEILVIPKFTSPNAKIAAEFLANTFACGGLKFSQRLAYLLRGKF